MSISFEQVNSESPRESQALYRRIRAEHYVADNGGVGRQLKYLIHYKGEVSGVIAGGMSSLGGKARNVFFGLDLAQRFDSYFAAEHEGLEPIQRLLRNACIINNTVFRLLNHEYGLASRVLSEWRHRVTKDWEKYEDGIPVLGFETYIVPHDHGNGLKRDGGCYRFDGWKYAGTTTTGKLLYCRKSEDFASLYSGEECLLPHEVSELFQDMYEHTNPWGTIRRRTASSDSK